MGDNKITLIKCPYCSKAIPIEWVEHYGDMNITRLYKWIKRKTVKKC